MLNNIQTPQVHVVSVSGSTVGHSGDFLPIELNELHPGQTSRSAVQKAFDDVRSRLTCRVQSDVSDNRSGSPDWFASEQETVAIKEKKKTKMAADRRADDKTIIGLGVCVD